jgi:hypothetical protein
MIPVYRPRSTWFMLPGNYVGAKKKAAQGYWSGYQDDWDGWNDLLHLSNDNGKLNEVAFVPALNDMVVLDCDRREYEPDTGWVSLSSASRAAFQRPVIRFGLDDLFREVKKLGHDPAELATYVVATPGGGHHLYFKQHPHLTVPTRHFRDNWRVDVIASQNLWVNAPPTRGYHVVRDLPVAVLPLWLAEFLVDLNQHLVPQGGRPRQVLNHQARQLLAQWYNDGSSHDVFRNWVRAELKLVELTNQVGGWNQQLYCCTRNLLDVGLSSEKVFTLIIKAAAPVDVKNRRQAEDTINSAIRAHTRTGFNGGRA